MMKKRKRNLDLQNDANHESSQTDLENISEKLVSWQNDLDEKNVPAILGCYSATLGQQDQKLYRLLYVYDASGVNFARFYPILWGPISVEKYEHLKKLGPALWNRPSEDDVLDLYEPEKLWMTALRFPLDLPADCPEDESSRIFGDLYDPRFCLTSFASVLDCHCLVSCKKFIQRNCLALVLACLSCHSDKLRSLAILVLSRFLFHLKALQTSSNAKRHSDGDVVFEQKTQFVYVLTFLKNSLPSPNARLPCIISHFFLRLCRLLLHPEDPLYAPLNAFLLLKPSLDIEHVPEFYKLFHSSSSENYKRERHWVLYLLTDGLREAEDYRLIENRYGFKLFLTFFDCTGMVDEKSRELILRIVRAAVSIPFAASDLCRKYNLIGWIAASANQKEADSFVAIFSRAWKTLALSELDKRSEESSEMDEGKIQKPKTLPDFLLGSILLCCSALLDLSRESENLENFKILTRHLDQIKTRVMH